MTGGRSDVNGDERQTRFLAPRDPFRAVLLRRHA